MPLSAQMAGDAEVSETEGIVGVFAALVGVELGAGEKAAVLDEVNGDGGDAGGLAGQVGAPDGKATRRPTGRLHDHFGEDESGAGGVAGRSGC